MRFKCMRVVAFIGMAGLAAMAQTGTAERANPPQFTSDQDFLKQAAELEHYSEIVEGWAKDHGSTPVRTAARQILYEQSVMANDMNHLAHQKHVDLPEHLTQTDQDNVDRMQALSGEHQRDRYLADEMLKSDRLLKAMFQQEAQQGSDNDIKQWAQRSIRTLQHHEQELEKLQKQIGA